MDNVEFQDELAIRIALKSARKLKKPLSVREHSRVSDFLGGDELFPEPNMWFLPHLFPLDEQAFLERIATIITTTEEAIARRPTEEFSYEQMFRTAEKNLDELAEIMKTERFNNLSEDAQNAVKNEVDKINKSLNSIEIIIRNSEEEFVLGRRDFASERINGTLRAVARATLDNTNETPVIVSRR